MSRGNPAMNEAVYERAQAVGEFSEPMTLQGSVLKSIVLMCILLATATYSWAQAGAGSNLTGGLIGGAITALITIFSPRSSPVTAPIYAALEGLVLGGISAFFEAKYHGLVLNAVGLSIGVLALMLFAYGTGIIPVTNKLIIGVVAATGAICLVYIVTSIMVMFGARVPLIHQAGPMGMAFSAVVVIIAALNLLLDFDFIEKGVQARAPKYMEWYGAFSLMVTLVWMYLEILRLLAKARGNGRS